MNHVLQASFTRYKQVVFNHDKVNNIVTIALDPIGRPCFNVPLLQELYSAQNEIKALNSKPTHLLLSSNTKDVFSFGGDLTLFSELVRQKDVAQLQNYMRLCIDVLMHTSYDDTLEKVALVQGAAFGGGFEAVLSCSTIIAEQSATFGFPERTFNLFPGMGAYSYLIRRVSPALAKRIISANRKVYSAEELHNLGIIDVLAEDGTGKDVAMSYIMNHQRYANGYNSIRDVVNYYHQIDTQELYDIGEKWIQACLKLGERDLRKMLLLAKGQEKYAN